MRCFVIDGKVVGSMQRKAAAGEFRANLHLGASASSIKITAEERKIAVAATKNMGLQVAGVDIIRSNSGPRVLEINSAPLSENGNPSLNLFVKLRLKTELF